jgi:hypothetical protein
LIDGNKKFLIFSNVVVPLVDLVVDTLVLGMIAVFVDLVALVVELVDFHYRMNMDNRHSAPEANVDYSL